MKQGDRFNVGHHGYGPVCPGGTPWPARTMLLGLIAGLGVGTASAGVGPESTFFEPLPVVLSVSRLLQPQSEAPAAVTVIDREMIRASGARDVWELFNLVPGFTAAYAPQEAPEVVYHGATGQFNRRMQVLIDGRSYFSPLYYGGVNWRMIPVILDDIERIEVVRGSNSAAFGSNALLGIANIVTRSGAHTPKATVQVVSGDQGVEDRLVRGGWQHEENSLRLSVQQKQDTGLDHFLDDQRDTIAEIRFDRQVSLTDSIRVSAGGIRSAFQVGKVGDPSDMLRQRVSSNSHFSLQWQRTISPENEVSVRYYRIDERNNDRFDYLFSTPAVSAPVAAFLYGLQGLPPPGALPSMQHTVPINYDFRASRDDLEVQINRGFGEHWRTVSGIQLRRDQVESAGFYFRQPPPTAALQRLFGHVEWRINPAWIANLGGSLEKESVGRPTFAPRAALNWHFSAGQTLRLGAARAYRSPSLLEQHGHWAFASATTGIVLERKLFATGSALRPERIDSLELGYLGEFERHGLHLDVRVFDERLADRIIQGRELLVAPNCELLAVPSLTCGEADDVINGQDLRMRGLEYQMRWRPFSQSSVILSQSFIKTHSWITARTGAMSDLDAEKLQSQADESAPTRATSVMWLQRLPWGIDFSVTHSSVGAMRWTSNARVSSRRRLDLRVAMPLVFGSTTGEVAFTVRNYRGSQGEYRPNQLVTERAFVSVRLDF